MISKVKAVVKNCGTYIFLKYKGVEFNYGKVHLHGLPMISKAKGSRIIIQDYVTINSNTKYNVAGINHKTILATMLPNSLILIGTGCGISGASIVATKKVELGEGVGLGVNVNIWDTDFHPVEVEQRLNQKSILEAKCAEIIINKHVWIGANSTICKGCNIGEGSVVGANSVVTKTIPPNVLAVGSPAKIIKEINIKPL